MTPPDVKICGLKTAETVTAALEAGAAYVGFVFFPPSPRHLTFEDAKVLRSRVSAYQHLSGRAVKVVALMVDPDDALVAQVIEAAAPDIIQLHGSETPARVQKIRAQTNLPVMKAIKVETKQDADRALAYKSVADMILFDAKAPKGAKLPGGNGVAFDWEAIEDVARQVDFMLSGGLTPENIVEAVRRTGALAVDVSSGVESAPGVKDIARINAFMDAIKTL